MPERDIQPTPTAISSAANSARSTRPPTNNTAVATPPPSTRNFARTTSYSLSMPRQDAPRSDLYPVESLDSPTYTESPWWPESSASSSSRPYSRYTAGSQDRVGRSRGASVSTTDGETIAEESDDELGKLGDASRRPTSKSRTKGQPAMPPGELSLPPRLPPLSHSGSLSSLTNVVQETARSTHSTPLPRRSTTSALGTTLPIRTGSGLNMPQPPKPLPINTHVSPPRYLWPDVSIAVTGTVGCGKSTLIKKGLKSYQLSEPAPFSVPSSYQETLTYILRTGVIPYDHYGRDCILGIMEIDINNLPTSKSLSGRRIWPGGMPHLEGAIICYDATDASSFEPVEQLIRSFYDLKLPTIVVACKADTDMRVETRKVNAICQPYDVGVIEVTTATDIGKDKMRRCFEWLLRAVFKDRRITRNDLHGPYRNPASPDMLANPPWDVSRPGTATPTAASSGHLPQVIHTSSSHSKLPSPVVSTPVSPTRARSTSDLRIRREQDNKLQRNSGPESTTHRDSISYPSQVNLSTGSLHGDDDTGDTMNGAEEHIEIQKEDKEDPRPAPWATLEQLLDKLLFLAVSGDDPAYITHFLLTYRRFATPRSLLLAMQKRMRQLDEPSADPMFACFAQMRICHLLEIWIQDYPGDFAVKGTNGALSALVKSIISNTHLLHYGSDLLPFLEVLPNQVDKDAAWAVMSQDQADESDDSSSMFEEDEVASLRESGSRRSGEAPPVPPKGLLPSGQSNARERKASLPLTAKALVMPRASPSTSYVVVESVEMSAKQIVRELFKLSAEVNDLSSADIAEEITRIEVRLFLDIKPRDWLQHTLVPGRKDPEHDSIARFSQVSSHLADWVVSLILCHDKPKARARQIEKFIDIAANLRRFNNYSALRAFVAGINNSTFHGDETMELFKDKYREHYKMLQSYDLLLQHIRSHRAYRMALRNTKGACIPALEVHISDLIRAHEGNPDISPHDPNRIHWGKFNLMGKFIAGTTQCQIQCRQSTDYNFPEKPHIRDLLMKEYLMDEELQQSRIAPASESGPAEESALAMPRTGPRHTKDPALLKRLMFW